MLKTGDYSVPYIFYDEEMQTNFHRNLFISPLPVEEPSIWKASLFSLSHVFEVFKFQGWTDFLRISEDTYRGLVPAFYSTLVPTNEDNTSFKSIIRSFEIQVLPSIIAQITNTPNKGILYRARERWWEELGASKEDVAGVLIRNRNMHVREIKTSNLLIPVRVVHSIVQHIILPRMGNIDLMTEMDKMVMFCLMTKRRINLVRLILDFILSTMDVARRSHAALPYGIFLTRVFTRA